MLVTKLSRVYAKSLFELAGEQNSREEVKREMEMVSQLIQDSREFANLLQSPVVKPDVKQKIFKEIFAGKLGDLSLKFCMLVIDHNREGSLRSIVEAYRQMYLKSLGIARAKVTTAYQLSEKELKDLQTKLAESTGKEIQIENKVNPDIIGGLIVRVGDQRYNGSIAAELRRLRRDFEHNHYIADF